MTGPAVDLTDDERQVLALYREALTIAPDDNVVHLLVVVPVAVELARDPAAMRKAVMAGAMHALVDQIAAQASGDTGGDTTA